MDAALLAAPVTAHDQRCHGKDPDGLVAVARRFGKTYGAAASRYHKLRKQAGLSGLWTKTGLWTEDEDRIIREYARDATPDWEAVGDLLGRTAGACRLREYNLRKREAATA